MSKDIRTRLKELNPDLFSGKQPSAEHEVLIIGRREEKKGINYLLVTEPSDAAIAAKFKPVRFFHAAFKPTGSVKTDTNGKRSFSGMKKARVGNIFQPTQPDLYQYIREAIYKQEEDENGKPKFILLDEKDGTYKKAGFDALNRPQIRLRDTVFGSRVVIITDLYTPHSVDPETGMSVPLVANTRNPKTGKYEPKEVVMGSYEFFADDDDLGNLLEVCARHWTKNVEPWIKETVEVKTTKGSTVKTEIVEPTMTGTEDFIIDENLNAVDDLGDIQYSKKKLIEMGITPVEGETVKLKRAS